MPFKPNYRSERAARARSKEARKAEKLEVQAARRKANRNTASPDTNEDHHGVERTSEEKGE